MSKSVLLTIARRSIEEVLQAEETIDRSALLAEYPLLAQPIATRVELYLEEKLRGSSASTDLSRSLLEDIIYNAKCAAFQDPSFVPISTSEYLHCTITLTLYTQEGEMMHSDSPILKER